MAKANGLPILIAGGGIGGLAAAYALARKGFAVRVLEQAPEFKELGAGIQLGPNIFRALNRIGLSREMLEDAWQPSAQEMRDAVTGEVITHIPLGEPFMAHFKEPYAVTHRADIHGVFLRACQQSNLISLENNNRVDDFVDNGETVTATLQSGETYSSRRRPGSSRSRSMRGSYPARASPSVRLAFGLRPIRPSSSVGQRPTDS